jgi:hypothetical protein
MKAIVISAVALLSVAGVFAVASQETKKTTDECGKAKNADCCSTKAHSCSEKKMDGCCDTMKDECCTQASVDDCKRTCAHQHGVQDSKSTKTLQSDVKPYPLKTCVVSGEELGKMGEPFRFTYKGQEIKLCCKGCEKDFNKEPEKFLQKIAGAAGK